MLKTVNIHSLFGFYSYSLPLINSSNNTISFITGPNGYGKTTILEVSQIRSVEQEDNVDEEGYTNVQLKMHFFHETRNDFHEVFYWDNHSPQEEHSINNFSTYLSSHPIYYIK